MYVWVKPRPHTHTECGTEVSSSVPHFLQVGLLLNPIIYRCLLRVLCLSRRPVTTLDCVLLKDRNRAFVAGLGPKINSRSCLWVLHCAKFWLSTQHLILLLIFCLETPRDGSGPINFWVEPPLVSLSAISFPHTPASPGIQYCPTVCWVEYALVTVVIQSRGSSSFLFYSIGFSYQYKSTSLSAIQVKSWQTIVSMEEKLDIMSRLELSEWIIDIWCNVRFTHSSILMPTDL
jgi:hypothetical protein